MLFPTVTFAVFFVVVYAFHVALRPRPRAWKVAMIVASYAFYGWWDWRFCGLLAGSTLLNWLAGRALVATTGRLRRAVLGLAVTADLGLLCLFKYYGFFVETVSSTVGRAVTLPALDLVLPIGISFFTFQAISHVVDVYRHASRPPDLSGVPISTRADQVSLLDFCLYLSFFPHLVAGPIVRSSELVPQLPSTRLPAIPWSFSPRSPARPAAAPPPPGPDGADAAWSIGRGLFKKVVVATYLARTVVDPVFAAPSLATRPQLLAALYGYAIQIYADFSGYTDIAIGLAGLLGIRFPANFDRPYGSRSMQDFWRRWHMSLSRWLRDYLYIPLGGSRGSERTTHRNLMATMVLGGLWHGAAWTFVAWGTVHGAALSVERLAERRWPTADGHRWVPAARWLVTFNLVCLAWIPFRAETLGLAGQFVAGMATAPWATAPGGTSVDLMAVAVITAALAAQVLPRRLLGQGWRLVTRLDPVAQGGLAGAWLFLVVALGPDGVAPFIYFRF